MQIVDRQPGEVADRVERSRRAAGGVRGVDLRGEDRIRAADLDHHVARQGQHRDRVRLRVGAEQHQRVGARRSALRLAVAAVVADHERDRRLVGRRHAVERRLRGLHVRRVGADRGDALVQPEVDAADERHDERSHAGGDDAEHASREGPCRRGVEACGASYTVTGESASGGSIARPLPPAAALRPWPRFSVVRTVSEATHRTDMARSSHRATIPDATERLSAQPGSYPRLGPSQRSTSANGRSLRAA